MPLDGVAAPSGVDGILQRQAPVPKTTWPGNHLFIGEAPETGTNPKTRMRLLTERVQAMIEI